jgi:hypothetical protein
MNDQTFTPTGVGSKQVATATINSTVEKRGGSEARTIDNQADNSRASGLRYRPRKLGWSETAHQPRTQVHRCGHPQKE